MRGEHDGEIHRIFGRLWKGTYNHDATGRVEFDYTLGTTWTYGGRFNEQPSIWRQEVNYDRAQEDQYAFVGRGEAGTG